MKSLKFLLLIAILASLFSTCKKAPNYPEPHYIHYAGTVLDGNKRPIKNAKIAVGEGYGGGYAFSSPGKTDAIAYSDSFGRFSIDYYDKYPWCYDKDADWNVPFYNSVHLNFVWCAKKNYNDVLMFERHIYTDTIILSEYSYAKVILNPVKTLADGVSITMSSSDTFINYKTNPYGQNNDNRGHCRNENPRKAEFIVRASENYKIYISGQIFPGGYCETHNFRDTIQTKYTHNDTVVYYFDY